MLSYNESIAICAQNENPFVENKPYNPDHVLGWIITHLLDGFAPANQEEADTLKQLYIATIQFLMDRNLPVDEHSIVTLRDEIKASFESACEQATEVVTPSESQEGTATKACVTAMPKAYEFSALGKSLTVKKQYVHIAVALLIILLLYKIFK